MIPLLFLLIPPSVLWKLVQLHCLHGDFSEHCCSLFITWNKKESKTVYLKLQCIIFNLCWLQKLSNYCCGNRPYTLTSLCPAHTNEMWNHYTWWKTYYDLVITGCLIKYIFHRNVLLLHSLICLKCPVVFCFQWLSCKILGSRAKNPQTICQGHPDDS